MIARNFEILDEHGLHAVPAQLLAKLVKSADFAVFAEDPTEGRFKADDLLRLMSLRVHQGQHLKIIVDTPDAGEAEVFFEEVWDILRPRPVR